MVNRHTALLHQLFQLAITQWAGQVPAHTGEHDIPLEMGPFDAHHALSPSYPLSHEGRSYPRWHANENLRHTWTRNRRQGGIEQTMRRYSGSASRVQPLAGQQVHEPAVDHPHARRPPTFTLAVIRQVR